MQYVFGKDHVNDPPVVTMASDHVVFPIDSGVSQTLAPTTETSATTPATSVFPEWQCWNDYGIGLLLEKQRERERGELSRPRRPLIMSKN